MALVNIDDSATEESRKRQIRAFTGHRSRLWHRASRLSEGNKAARQFHVLLVFTAAGIRSLGCVWLSFSL